MVHGTRDKRNGFVILQMWNCAAHRFGKSFVMEKNPFPFDAACVRGIVGRAFYRVIAVMVSYLKCLFCQVCVCVQKLSNPRAAFERLRCCGRWFVWQHWLVSFFIRNHSRIETHVLKTHCLIKLSICRIFWRFSGIFDKPWTKNTIRNDWK